MALDTYKNLPERLKRQASIIEDEGWCTAARLMCEAAYVLQHLHDQGIIELPMEDKDGV